MANIEYKEKVRFELYFETEDGNQGGYVEYGLIRTICYLIGALYKKKHLYGFYLKGITIATKKVLKSIKDPDGIYKK